MDPLERQKLRYLADASHSVIADSRESCRDGERHVELSHEIVARSFRLLAQRFWHLRD